MKNIRSLVVALALAAPVQAQQLKATQVPGAVVAGFHHQFPHVKNVTWEREGNYYEAGFKQAGTEMSALLDTAGELVETESAMAISQLPAPVRTALASRYQSYRITEAAKIVTIRTGTITYEAEISQEGKKRDVLFDATGQEVKK